MEYPSLQNNVDLQSIMDEVQQQPEPVPEPQPELHLPPMEQDLAELLHDCVINKNMQLTIPETILSTQAIRLLFSIQKDLQMLKGAVAEILRANIKLADKKINQVQKLVVKEGNDAQTEEKTNEEEINTQDTSRTNKKKKPTRVRKSSKRTKATRGNAKK
jgi:hypothetical protein